MKRYFKVLLLSFVCFLGIAATKQTVFAEEVELNETNFPDASLRNTLMEYAEEKQDGTNPETGEPIYKNVIETDDITWLYLDNYSSDDFTPLACFTNLNGITISESSMTTMDLTCLPNLATLSCSHNTKLTSVKLGSGVTYASFYDCELLTSVNTSAASKLTEINFQDTKIKSFDGSALSKLTTIYIDSCASLTSIKTGSAVSKLYVSGSKALSSLQIAAPAKLTELSLYNTKLSSLAFSKMTQLKNLYIFGGNFKSVNVSGLKKLTELQIMSNKTITSVKVGPAMTTLNLNDTKALTSLSIAAPKKMQYLAVCGTKLKKLDLSKTTNVTSLVVSNNPNMTKVDTSKLTKLVTLTLNGNKKLKSISIKKNTKLESLFLAESVLSTVDTSKNTKLTSIAVYDSKISKLNLKKNTKLTNLDVSGSKVSSLDLSKNKQLANISINGSKLKGLNLTGNTKLCGISLTPAQCKKTKVPSGTSISVYTKPGTTLDLKYMIGTGYTCSADKSYLLSYSKTKGTLTWNKKYKGSFAYCSLKKGKKIYYISLCNW